MSEYSVDEVRQQKNRLKSGNYSKADLLHIQRMLTAYADLLEQIQRAQQGVTDEVVEIAAERHMRVRGIGMHAPWQTMTEETRIDYRAAMRAALQSVAHLLPSGDREGLDQRVAVRLAQYGAEYAYRHKGWSIEALQDGCEEHIDGWIKQSGATPYPPAQAAQMDASEQASEWFMREFGDLNPATACLVWNFALALGNKLADAEKKYGYTDGWRSRDWMDECRAHLMQHITKVDPRDVAAYCAFLWHHGASTAPTAEPMAQGELDVAKFGHHPDPATDFCVEVEALLGEIENRRIGFENGTPNQAELDQRIERAMSFRVGGDPHAVMAKQQLRAATTAEPVPGGQVLVRESMVRHWQRELNAARQGDNAQERSAHVHASITTTLAAAPSPGEPS